MNILRMKLMAAGQLRFQEKADGDGADGGGNGGGDQAAADKAAADQAAADKAEFDEFQNWKKNKAAGSKKPEESAYDRIKREQKASDQAGADKALIESDVRFDLSFDKLVDKGGFSLTSEKFRESANTLTGEQKIHTIKCTALKDYFANEENLKMLNEQDQAVVKSQIIGQHDNNIDSRKHWALLENAMFISERIALANGQRGTGGGSNSETPKLNAFIENAKNKMRGIKATV